MDWTLYFTEVAEAMLLRNEDRRVRRLLNEWVMRLRSNPEMQGKPLGGDLAGLRSIRAVGQRYRIIYELFPEDHEVWSLRSAFARPEAGMMFTR
jgi:mRNA interferase RelE/StbE